MMDPELCPSCDGSGEGRTDGSRCRECRGTGEAGERERYEDEKAEKAERKWQEMRDEGGED